MVRLNDLYELDMKSKLWTFVDISPSPSGRSFSSFTLVPSAEKIVLYGGLCSEGRSLNDVWNLDLSPYFKSLASSESVTAQQSKSPAAKPKWTEANSKMTREIFRIEDRFFVGLHLNLPKRLWHCGCLISRENGATDGSHGEEALLFYGGMDRSPNAPDPCVNTLLAHPLQPPPLYTLSLRAVGRHKIRIGDALPKHVEKQFRTYDELRAAWMSGGRKPSQKVIYEPKGDKTPWLAKIFNLISA